MVYSNSTDMVSLQEKLPESKWKFPFHKSDLLDYAADTKCSLDGK